MNANCSVMADLSQSRFLLSSLSFNLVTASSALPILTWASMKLWTGVHTQKFHKNMRIIVQMHLFGFILHCLGRVALHTLDLFNYNFLQPCDMIPNIYRCFILRLMYNTGMWLTTCTAVSIVIERSVATWRMGVYEKCGVWLGVVLALFQIGVAAVPLSFAYSNTKFDGVFMPYCSVYKPGFQTVAQANSIAAILAQFMARVLFSVLFRLNKDLREQRLSSTLSTRFQLEQNKASMQCLKIYANLSTTYLFTQVLSFMYLFQVSTDMPKQHYLAFMEFNCQLPVYGVLTVALVTRKVGSLQNQIRVDLKSHVDVGKKDGTEIYHQNFERMLNEGVVARRSVFCV